ncbi:hypothetical protein H0O01_04540 [Candidatus Micrarchaeota archaeon]|nr:hypothetical protein [Candidatus Micrarchaeota archaeon]
MNNMPDDGLIRKPPAQSPSPVHTQRFRVPNRPRHETTGMYTSHEGIADLTLKRVHESRLAQDEIAKIFSSGSQTVTSVKNILRNAVVEEDRLARFVSDDNGKPIDIDAIRDSIIGVSEFAPSAKFDHPEGGTSLHLAVSILYCNEPVGRRFLLSNAPIGTLGLLEKFSSCITGKRSLTLSGNPGESRYIYLATADIEKVVLGLCSRYPATDSTLIHLEEVRHSSGSAPVIDLPAPTKGHEQDKMFMTEREMAQARKRETSIPAPAKIIAPPVPEQEPQPEAPAAQEAPKPPPEAVPAGKQVFTNTLGLGLEDLKGRKKVGNESELRAMFNTPYSCYSIRTENGHEIRAAEETRFVSFLGEHPEFLPVSELEKGDIIYLRTKTGPAPERITEINGVESGQSVVLRRIRVERERMIFADGFAVSGTVSLLLDAMVDTPMGKKKAEELERGNEVVSFSNGEYRASSIANTLEVETGFRGIEIELKSGMRLLVIPIHPHTLADKCPAVLEYADTARFMEVGYEDGKKRYYVLVKPRGSGVSPGFSLSPMGNTLQVLEDLRPVEKPSGLACLPEHFASPPSPEGAETAAPAIQEAGPQAPATEKAELQPSAQFEFPAEPPAPVLPETAHPAEEAHDGIPLEAEPPREAMLPSSPEKAREEKFDEVRKFAFGILGNSPVPPEEAIFGENIAILVQNGGRHYLVTDAAEWNAAREAMEKHLSETEGTMLTEIQTAYARKKMHLASGGDVTVFVKPVGKSRVYKGAHGKSHSDTLEVMPGKAVAAAIGRAENGPSPEQQRWRARAIYLIRGAHLPLSGANDDAVLDLFTDPDSIVEAQPGPERYIIAKTSKGREYALFSFPCRPEEMNPDISGMPAVLVFTNPSYLGYSLLLMETKFLTPGLTDMMLANWKAAR